MPVGRQQRQRQIFQMKSQRGTRQRYQWTLKSGIARLLTALTRIVMQVHKRRYDRKRVRIYEMTFNASEIGCQITDNLSWI
jgi:hypothetical protein